MMRKCDRPQQVTSVAKRDMNDAKSDTGRYKVRRVAVGGRMGRGSLPSCSEIMREKECCSAMQDPIALCGEISDGREVRVESWGRCAEVNFGSQRGGRYCKHTSSLNIIDLRARGRLELRAQEMS